MRRGVGRIGMAVAAMTIAATAAGCSSSPTPVIAPPLTTDAVTEAPFAAGQDPALTAMALTPASTTTLRVTDWSALRLDLGFADLTSASPTAQRDLFVQRAQGAAIATDVLLGPDDAELRARYGFGAFDVAWEAQFTGGDADGFAIALDPAVPDDAVERAVRDGAGPLQGATYYPGTHVILSGGTTDPSTSWYADDSLTALAGAGNVGTVVHRGCLPAEVALSGAPLAEQISLTARAGLQPLNAFAVGVGTSLATAQLGAARTDAFDRARLGEEVGDTSFTRVYADALADPEDGRLGFDVAAPRQAIELALAGHLPFASCES